MRIQDLKRRLAAFGAVLLAATGADAQEYGGDFNQKEVAFSAKLPLREGRLVGVLLSDWDYCYPKTGDVFRVPRSYITDYASVPWYTRYAGFSEFGPHKYAALIHDWLYSVGEGKGTAEEASKRKEADEIFLFALKQAGMGFAKRRAMYRAVRLGGAEAYGREPEWTERFAVLQDGRVVADRLAEPPPKPARAAILNVPGCVNSGEALQENGL